METQEILKTVNKIFNEILDQGTVVLVPGTEANDVPEWDSLFHIQLIVAIEKHFHIRFTALEIQNWKNAGQMIDSIKSRLT
jgi:acyl carrier protein